MEESKYSGYLQKDYGKRVKRYCQTLELKDDPSLIAEYKKRHSRAFAWPEIIDGIRSVGILEMEIYNVGTKLFMIVETTPDFEWDEAFKKLATLPRQAEWEDYMSIFQMAEPGVSSAEKWTLMERIFHLYEK